LVFEIRHDAQCSFITTIATIYYIIIGGKMNTDKFQYDEKRYQEVFNKAWDDSQKARLNLTDKQKEHIKKLREQGYTLKKIAHIYNISSTAVMYLTK
jgi:DNA-directed RNA polymerase specialized sigma24 family protein